MDPADDDEPPSRRGSLIALLAVAVLIVAGWFLSDILRAASAIQDCVMSGRHNCVIFH
jgi:hypothetical protein